MTNPMTATHLLSSKRERRVEAIAITIREKSRFPSGGLRISLDTCREIAEATYSYMQKEGIICP